MSLVEKEKLKEPLILKVVMYVFIAIYVIVCPLLLFSALFGMLIVFATSGILSVIYMFAVPISMIAAIRYMRKMYESQQYTKVYLGMVPGGVVAFPFLIRFLF